MIFLPNRTTSKIQPLDAGVIAVLKKYYRSRQYKIALDLKQDEGTADMYKVSLLTAITWVHEIWAQMPASVLHNCWCKTCIITADQESVLEEVELVRTRVLKVKTIVLVN